jgi:L-ribulose-5-phosphate 3-epimerase
VNPIGIMQGRLSPPGPRPQTFPAASWREEFDRARNCGFDRIEWLLPDDRLDENPIWTDAGVADILGQADRTGVQVSSVCADCFISRALIADDRHANAKLLTRLIERSRHAGIAVVVVPILESSAIRTDTDRARLLGALRDPLAAAESSGVRIALESDLSGEELRSLIDASGSLSLGANYDIGNAAAAGHDSARGLRALGSRLFGVHVKDRVRNGPSQPLGEGDVDFDAVTRGLADAGYTAPLVLETPVGDDATQSARRNLAYLQSRLRTMTVAS